MGLSIFETGGISIFGKYQKGVTLDTCVGKGTWTASGTWTLPAFTAGGDISIGANKLKTTNLYLDEDNASTMSIRAISGDALRVITVSEILTASFQCAGDAAAFNASNSEGRYFTLQARDTGASALQEVMRIGGAAIPFMSMPADTQVGFFGVSVTGQSAAYTPTNVTADRSWDCDTVAVAELADVVATLVADLQLTGLIG